MKTFDCNGLIPAIVIPFKSDFSIDEEVLRKYINHISKSDIKALAINTDAGESHLLSNNEKKRIVSIVSEKLKGNIPLVCGISGTNTKDVVEFGKELKDLGVDAFLVFSHPLLRGEKNKDNAIIQYHSEISKIGLPIIIFQLQQELGGVEYNPETLKGLVEIKNVIAIKEASFDALKFKETVEFLNSLEKKIIILTGNDNFIPESFILGADGALIGFGSIFTDMQVQMIKNIKKRNYQEGFLIYKKIENICRLCFSSPVRNYRVRMKEVLVKQGIFKNSVVKPPLLPISDEEKQMIYSIMPK
jgi:4-hydroxy-tetrahydrodipicolinate synthase